VTVSVVSTLHPAAEIKTTPTATIHGIILFLIMSVPFSGWFGPDKHFLLR
jgi:hypothetical protein